MNENKVKPLYIAVFIKVCMCSFRANFKVRANYKTASKFWRHNLKRRLSKKVPFDRCLADKQTSLKLTHKAISVNVLALEIGPFGLLSGRPCRGLCLEQSLSKNLAHVLYKYKFQIVSNFLRQILKIAAVWFRENHRFYLRSPGREQLFFDS